MQMLPQLGNDTITGSLYKTKQQNKQTKKHIWTISCFSVWHIVIRFNLSKWVVVKKVSLPFAEPASYSLSSEMVGELAWSTLDIFTHISCLKFWKGMTFFFFFNNGVGHQSMLTWATLKSRPQNLTVALSSVSCRVIKASDFVALAGLSPEPASPLTNFSFTLGQQPGPGFGDLQTISKQEYWLTKCFPEKTMDQVNRFTLEFYSTHPLWQF